MVQKDVGLDATFGTAELGPGKQRETERDGGRVQTEEFVLEPELVLACAQPLLIPKPRQRGKEQILE